MHNHLIKGRNLASPAKKPAPDDLEFAIHGLESAKDLESIKSWIELIAAVPGEDAVRALLQTYRNTHWRETKKMLLHALGSSASARALQHLVHIASDQSDLPLAEVAIQALAQNPSPIGQQFLMNLLGSSHTPLTTAILNALVQKPWLLNADKIAKLISELPRSERMLANLIVALGRLGLSEHASIIEEFLTLSVFESQRDLFVAALISAAKICGKRSLEKIMALPLEHDISIAELRRMTQASIHRRLTLGTSDLICLLQSESPEDLEAALDLLQQIPATKVWAEYQSSKQALAPQAEIWLRAMTQDSKRLEEDLQFLRQHLKMLSEASLSFICIKIANGLDPQQTKATKLYMNCFKELGLTQLLAQTAHPRISDELLKNLRDSDKSDKLQTVNILAQHALIYPSAHPTHESICQRLIKGLQDEHQDVRERCLRALGELHYHAKGLAESIRGLSSAKQVSLPSAIYYFSHLPDPTNVSFLLKTLKQEGSKDTPDLDLVASLLHTLKENLGENPDLSAPDLSLLQNSLKKLVDCAQAEKAFDFLAQYAVPACDDMVFAGLSTQAFLPLLSAVAAARLNQSDKIRERLLDLLQHPEPVIRIRSIDSLSRNHCYKSHKTLIQHFEHDQHREVLLMVQAFSSINPDPNSDYGSLQASLKRLLKQCSSLSGELEEAAQALIDSMDHQILMHAIGAEQAQDMHHDLDDALERDIPGYDAYSANMKTVLRNAELTLNRKDVFDHRIDQSTAIIQYVKAIDLLLHERLGAKLFQQRDETLLSKMQSTLYLLTFDSRQIQSQNYLDILQISTAFKDQNFPVNKLRSICSEIMSGRIVNQYNRVVDGLRAWAILFLLFGRNFSTIDGLRVAACLPLKKTDAATIDSISKALHGLQGIRNDAAHRGTTLDGEKLLQCRRQSLEVLAELSHLL